MSTVTPGTVHHHQAAPGSWWMERVGVKQAGRRLDGRLHDALPVRHTAHP